MVSKMIYTLFSIILQFKHNYSYIISSQMDHGKALDYLGDTKNILEILVL